VTAGGRAVSQPYYSQRAHSVCVSLRAFSFFLQLLFILDVTGHQTASMLLLQLLLLISISPGNISGAIKVRSDLQNINQHLLDL